MRATNTYAGFEGQPNEVYAYAIRIDPDGTVTYLIGPFRMMAVLDLCYMFHDSIMVAPSGRQFIHHELIPTPVQSLEANRISENGYDWVTRHHKEI